MPKKGIEDIDNEIPAVWGSLSTPPPDYYETAPHLSGNVIIIHTMGERISCEKSNENQIAYFTSIDWYLWTLQWDVANMMCFEQLQKMKRELRQWLVSYSTTKKQTKGSLSSCQFSEFLVQFRCNLLFLPFSSIFASIVAIPPPVPLSKDFPALTVQRDWEFENLRGSLCSHPPNHLLYDHNAI